VEVAKFFIYGRKIEEVSIFINVAYLYLSIKMTKEMETTKMAIMSWLQRRKIFPTHSST